MIPGVLQQYDVPDLIRAIAPRPVTQASGLQPSRVQ
jgi:hypothetical protein